MSYTCKANLIIELKNEQGKTVKKKTIKNIDVKGNGNVTPVESFRFKNKREGVYFIVYQLVKLAN